MLKELLGFVLGAGVDAVQRRLKRPTDADLRAAARAAVALGQGKRANELLVEAHARLAAAGVELTDDVVKRLRIAIAIEVMERDLNEIAERAQATVDKLGTVR
jgi:thiamine monophosphate synthase